MPTMHRAPLSSSSSLAACIHVPLRHVINSPVVCSSTSSSLPPPAAPLSSWISIPQLYFKMYQHMCPSVCSLLLLVCKCDLYCWSVRPGRGTPPLWLLLGFNRGTSSFLKHSLTLFTCCKRHSLKTGVELMRTPELLR